MSSLFSSYLVLYFISTISLLAQNANCYYHYNNNLILINISNKRLVIFVYIKKIATKYQLKIKLFYIVIFHL